MHHARTSRICTLQDLPISRTLSMAQKAAAASSSPAHRAISMVYDAFGRRTLANAGHARPSWAIEARQLPDA